MEVVKWREHSVADMLQKLNELNSNKLLLGEHSKSEEGEYIFQLNSRERVEFTVGVITEGYWLEPQCKYVYGKLLLGFNQEIHIIDISNNQDKIIETCSCFFEFQEGINSDTIIAIFEIEIICFSLNASIKWRYNTDIITNYSVKNDIINITTFSGGEETISLLTGRRI